MTCSLFLEVQTLKGNWDTREGLEPKKLAASEPLNSNQGLHLPAATVWMCASRQIT